MASNKDSIQRVLICNRTLQLLYPNLEREEYNFRQIKHEQLSLKEREVPYPLFHQQKFNLFH
jgi:hypothetical protein